jgi:BirA family biotin operon repressor/biotin-[acetyl-CoA-carboxylase] ligase
MRGSSHILDYTILRYGKVSSTNEAAKKVADRSSEEKLVVSAEVQTQGRGRAGRHWFSPRGGLWLSIVLRPAISPRMATRFTFAASLAVAETVRTMFGLEATVKWPNDVLVNSRKVCGILTETKTRNNKIEYIVVGIGINANIDIHSFPRSLQGVATSLKHELGFKTDLALLTEMLLREFDERYMNVLSGKWSMLLWKWKSIAPFLGKKVQITNSQGVLVGKAQNVDDDGALEIALENGATAKIVFGDMRLQEL